MRYLNYCPLIKILTKTVLESSNCEPYEVKEEVRGGGDQLLAIMIMAGGGEV